MSQYAFGSGILWATPQNDAFGNAIATPTPIMVGIMQEGSIDISFDTKELYGQNQFPVAVGRGKGKITGKSKFAQLFGAMFSAVIFGQAMTGGLLAARYDTSGTTIPASPNQITVTPPSSGTFSNDFGVVSSTGVPFARVASNPAKGQYTVTAGGVYTFAASDAGAMVFINYEYSVSAASAPGSQTQTIMNLPMGYAPSFKADFFLPYMGKSMKITLPNCISSKLSLGSKQDDFMVPEFDFSGFASAAGQVATISTSE